MSSQEILQPLDITQQDVASNQTSSCEKITGSSSQPSQAFSFLNKENDFKLDQWKNYCQILLVSLIGAIAAYVGRVACHFLIKYENTDELIWNTVLTFGWFGFIYWIYCNALKRKKWTMKYGIGVYLFTLMAVVIEAWIADNPDRFSTSYYVINVLAIVEYVELAIDMPVQTKKTIRRFIWALYLIRNYLHYDDFDIKMILGVVASITVQDMSSNLFDQYLKSIKTQTKKMQDLFKNTLTVIPNGVIIIDIKTKAITYANMEMELIVQTINEENLSQNQTNRSLQERICDFILCDSILGRRDSAQFNQFTKGVKNEEFRQEYNNSTPKAQHRNSISSEQRLHQDKQHKQKQNLWDFMIDLLESQNLERKETVFKAKNPKRYIQVKPSLINNGGQLLVICSDITRIKQVESQGRKLRASFFSSVAHELRTPLNSIIPIIKMVLDILEGCSKGKTVNFEKLNKLLNIVKNSSYHLQSVIEDALDISRLENNQFQIFKESMDVRAVVEQVCEIMKFQVQEKGLQFSVNVANSVPNTFLSDIKRVKQVLFNLLGNAIKFTFSGRISVNVDFDEETNQLTGKVSDTGLGIKEADLEKLFKFFGCLVTTKDINRGGMGLGLTISKMIIQQLGGDISVESIPGVGSTFTFTIPIEEYDSFEKKQTFHDILYHSDYTDQEIDTFTPKRFFQKVTIQEDTKEQFGDDTCLQVPSEQNLGIKLQLFNSKKNIVLSKRKSVLNQREIIIISDISENIQNCTTLIADAEQMHMMPQNVQNRNPLIDNCAPKLLNECTKTAEVEIQNFQASVLPRILCVDDSTYNLFVIKESLQLINEQLQINTALNGQIAFDKIFDAHQKTIKNQAVDSLYYDLLLLDLHMPVLDGFQTARLIREAISSGRMLQGNLQIYAISAISESQFISNPFSRYFDGFIEKPVSEERLGDILQSIKMKGQQGDLQ
ncbi:hypothetical protein FGO68_gene3927 [Halteria grandinella]|uniref:Multi-sensor hybrid histidine kinase n=1 Tax=Halteria grandinella TaxID=5974 RepID=A0A8J8P2Y6_HALGN|nr:hypothetical protein FGO68_gene3927 [Halteria grandinella]